MKDKNIIIKTKKTDFLSMFKSMFWSPEEPEKTDEEDILLSNESDDIKKTLLESLENSDKLANNLFRKSYKVTTLKRNNLKEDAKVAIKQMSNENEESRENAKESSDNERI